LLAFLAAEAPPAVEVGVTQPLSISLDAETSASGFFALRRAVFHPEPGRAREGLSATGA